MYTLEFFFPFVKLLFLAMSIYTIYINFNHTLHEFDVEMSEYSTKLSVLRLGPLIEPKEILA